MDMTEQEANKKWCPMSRPVTRDDEPQQCVASECMMWRWAEGGAGAGGKERGHCGLAGKPLV